MTPKEKAEELLGKYIQTNGNSFFAKECAIIAVEEITEAVKIAQTDIVEYQEYWQDVKEEIEKL